MQLNDWLNRLERLHFKSIDMGLERIQAVAATLGLLNNSTEKTPFIFTVAGTNGKGSTVTVIDTILRHAGYQTGLYTSPHLVRFNERIQVNGAQCNDAALIQAFEAVNAARHGVSLTYFEFTTLAAIWLFQQQKLDAWILEVGLGGRLDAVNIWNADVAVVTSIGIDHEQWLGDSREQIGLEKIGIGRRGKPLVLGEANTPQNVLQSCHDQGFQVYQRSVDFDESSFAINALPLSSMYPQNVATALQALALSPLNIDQSDIAQTLSGIQLTGRKQRICTKPDVILDVGHNPHAAKALATHIEQMQHHRVHCIVGMLADKAVTETLMELLPVVDYWYPASLDADRAMPTIQVASALQGMGAVLGASPSAAPSAICKALVEKVDKNDLILVFGSFYTVSDVIQYGDLERVAKE
jgi:dihydrofolate synthase/folylpolyglutamate synthase